MDTSITKMVEFITKYKLYFEDIQDRLVVFKSLVRSAAYFEDAVRFTVNITVNSTRIITQEKQSGSENNKKEDYQVISHEKYMK